MSAPSVENIERTLQDTVITLIDYIRRSDFRSYDYVDWWATNWGQQTKQLIYRTEPIGLVFSLPVQALEWWFPFLRRPLGIQKRVAPIVVAQHGLACLELFQKTCDEAWLQAARADATRLVSLAVPGAKGMCWGFPFPWSNNSGIVPPDQPAATQTAYGFDLFEHLWRISGQKVYWEWMMQVVYAMDQEYIDVPRPAGLASTYLGRGYGDVVLNAITYRIYILTRAVANGVERFRGKLMDLLGYVLAQQQPDGSWFYGESPKNRFIDHYHTCFVIKNLVRTNTVLEIPELSRVIRCGIDFYWSSLFDEHRLPKPYARTARLNVVKYESYDFAECLGLFALLGPDHGFTLERLCLILDAFLQIFWLPSGALRARVYYLPTAREYPYYRSGMSAALLSMAQLLNSNLLRQESLVA